MAQKVNLPGKTKEEKLFGKKKKIDKKDTTPYIDAKASMPELTEPEEKVVVLIRGGNTQVDDIMAQADLNAGGILAAHTMLEIRGVIRRLPGKRVEVNNP